MRVHPPHDRLTVPLVRAATELVFVCSLWGTTTASGVTGPWVLACLGGWLASTLYWNPYRVLGLIPPGLTLTFAATLVAWGWGWSPITGVLVSMGLGLALGAVLNAKLRGMALPISRVWRVLPTFVCLILALLPLVGGIAGDARDRALESYTLGAVVAAGAGAAFTWRRLFRPTFELMCEPVLWAMYRVRLVGMGAAAIPARGPCLILANHGCWFDPLFLAKALPRRTTPMMTDQFYDLPVLRWLMRGFGVIRVPDRRIKREAPEVGEAIAALDRGECVVIFPEGFLRRHEEQPLRRFGRGVWQILSARPTTPVFVCWIEGGWGSYTSHFNGKPTQNKKPDARRTIGVGMCGPVPIDEAILANHLYTRVYLMNQVAAARKPLDLPDLPRYELPERDEPDGRDE